MSQPLPVPATYEPYHEIGDRPHIVVDGKSQDSTLLTLSHWPWNNTPEPLRRDTSTHIAFAYLARPEFHIDGSLVSNSHYDEDGLLSMFATTHPELAWQHRDWLVKTSYASDFWRCTDEDAAKLSFVLAAWTDPDTSPLPAEIFELPLRQLITEEYRLMLEALPAILENPYKDESLWCDEYDFWQDSVRLVEEGAVTLEEFPDIDTVVVRVPETLPKHTIRRYLTHWSLPVHPFAIYAKTDCSRVVWIQGDNFEMHYRYESWVRVESFRPHPRVDMQPFADQLKSLSTDNDSWVFDGVHEVAAMLHLEGDGPSGISESLFLERLIGFLRAAPSAWDPRGKPPQQTGKSSDDQE